MKQKAPIMNIPVCMVAVRSGASALQLLHGASCNRLGFCCYAVIQMQFLLSSPSHNVSVVQMPTKRTLVLDKGQVNVKDLLEVQVKYPQWQLHLEIDPAARTGMPQVKPPTPDPLPPPSFTAGFLVVDGVDQFPRSGLL